MRLFEIKMPETGDVGEIVVTDVLIQANQHIAFDQPMITVETDMATMEIPSVYLDKVFFFSIWKRKKQVSRFRDIEID